MPVKETENELESVELQMNIIRVSDNECISMKVLVKVAPLQSDAVNMLDAVNIFNSVNAFDSWTIIQKMIKIQDPQLSHIK